MSLVFTLSLSLFVQITGELYHWHKALKTIPLDQFMFLLHNSFHHNILNAVNIQCFLGNCYAVSVDVKVD